ncbi:MAG: hypothetical protein N2439_00440 [Anaerolineae bacterium]|nr:hypothetical protein [Anaerolineae bacterium]
MNGGTSALPPQAVEAELNQALALLNSLLSSQAEPSESPLPTATTDTSTNAPPAPAPTETVPQPAATMTEPAVPETPPDATPVATTNAATGHWVFDPATGWVWEPEAGAPVATAPVVEVYPGGWVTIHSRPRPAGSPGTLMKKGAMRPSQMKKK